MKLMLIAFPDDYCGPVFYQEDGYNIDTIDDSLDFTGKQKEIVKRLNSVIKRRMDIYNDSDEN